MADDNLDDIQDGIRGVSASMQEFLDRLRRNVSISENELRNFARTTGVAEHQLKAMADSAKNAREFGNSLIGLTASLGRGKTNFGVLNSAIEATANILGSLMSAIPLVGSALNAGAQAVGKASAYMVEQFDNAYGSFESLSRSGLIGAEGIDHMTEGFDRLAVPLEVYQRLLEGNSRRLAQLSGSAFSAADSITTVAGNIKKSGLDMQLRTLGYSSEEIADTMIQYADIQRRIGNTQYMDQERLKRGTIEYAKELDAIAKLTGLSRKQLKEQTDAAMRNARFQAKIRQLEASGQGEAAQRLVKLNMALANYPELQKGFQDATTGFVNSPEARKAFLTTGGRLGSIIEDSIQGADLGESLQGLSDATKSTMSAQESLALAGGDAPGVFIPLYESTGLATANLGDLATAVKTNYDTMSDASTNFRENTKNLAEAKVNLESASSGITRLALSADFAATGIEKLSGAIDDIVQWVKGQLLGETPGPAPTSGARRQQSRAETKAAGEQKREALRAELKAAEEKLAANKRGELDLTAAELKALRSTVNRNTDELTTLNDTISDLISTDSKLTGRGRGATARPKPEGSEEPKTETKEPAPTVAPKEEPKTETKEPAPTVAPKEVSTAKTIKIGRVEIEKPAVENVTGSSPTGPKTETPTELDQGYRFGGVATGPKSGYRATLHGTEAVVPLEGKSIPVEIKDTRDMRPQLEMMEKQISKLDAMIAAIEKNTGINEKILRASSN